MYIVRCCASNTILVKSRFLRNTHFNKHTHTHTDPYNIINNRPLKVICPFIFRHWIYSIYCEAAAVKDTQAFNIIDCAHSVYTYTALLNGKSKWMVMRLFWGQITLCRRAMVWWGRLSGVHLALVTFKVARARPPPLYSQSLTTMQLTITHAGPPRCAV